jgi:intracellular septation protein A
MVIVMAGQPVGSIPTEQIGVGAAVRRSGPRLLRDGFGPLAIFFVGWKVWGLGAGIAGAVGFGLAVFVHERRQGRPATVVRLALVLVAIRATVGVVSGSASTYLATEIAIDALLAATVLGSMATQRPFASWFAAEVYPFPREVLDSPTYRDVMRRITLVWGAYFLLRGMTRLAALQTLSTDRYALVVGLTDAPFLLALLAWSAYYSIDRFRHSEELGPLIAAAEASR